MINKLILEIKNMDMPIVKAMKVGLKFPLYYAYLLLSYYLYTIHIQLLILYMILV